MVRSDISGVNVQRFATDVDGQLVTNQTISSVDLDRAVIIPSGHCTQGFWPISSSTSGSVTDPYLHTLIFTSATNVQLERRANTGITGSNNFFRYEVLAFAEEGGDIVLPADSGSYAWSGTDASLLYDRILGADSGSFAWTGQDVTFRISRKIDAESGGYAWTGQDATLRYTPASVLPASPGNYSWQGQDVTFRRTYILKAETGVYSWTGQNADLFKGDKPERKPAGLPERKRRRYILPNNMVYDDPDRALFELRRYLLDAQAKSRTEEPDGPDGVPSTSIARVDSDPAQAPSGPLTTGLMQGVVLDLPDLIRAQPIEAEPIDPQLLSVLFQRIDDEEAAMLLLYD